MNMGNAKSLWWAYWWWLVGGLVGLHHIYLGRDRQAIAYWISFGGYFGLAWLRDAWKLAEYVAEANETPEYLEKLTSQMRERTKPCMGVTRIFASIVVADVLGYLVIGAIPHELFSPDGSNDNLVSRLLVSTLAPLACALGVHIVGNIGRHSGSLRPALLASYLTAPFYTPTYSPVFFSSVLSLIAFCRYSLTWRRTRSPIRLTRRRIILLLVSVTLFTGLWSSWFYFNCSVTDKDEQTIKCRQAFTNFFNSPVWLEFTNVLRNLWLFLQREGWSGLWREIVEAFDPAGEKNALKIFGLKEEEASQEVITSTYRKLARQWHPDKHQSQNEKKVAQERFMELQQAYELLSKRKQSQRKQIMK